MSSRRSVRDNLMSFNQVATTLKPKERQTVVERTKQILTEQSEQDQKFVRHTLKQKIVTTGTHEGQTFTLSGSQPKETNFERSTIKKIEEPKVSVRSLVASSSNEPAEADNISDKIDSDEEIADKVEVSGSASHKDNFGNFQFSFNK